MVVVREQCERSRAKEDRLLTGKQMWFYHRMNHTLRLTFITYSHTHAGSVGACTHTHTNSRFFTLPLSINAVYCFRCCCTSVVFYYSHYLSLPTDPPSSWFHKSIDGSPEATTALWGYVYCKCSGCSCSVPTMLLCCALYRTNRHSTVRSRLPPSESQPLLCWFSGLIHWR